MVKKFTKKIIRKGTKTLKKNYSGKGSISRVLRDVTMLKSLINVEKKVFIYTGGAIAAQQNSTTSQQAAYGMSNIADGFSIPQGVQGGPSNTAAISTLNNGQRIGNSIKVTNMRFNIRIQQQTATNNELRYRIVICRKKDCVTAMSPLDVSKSLFEPNPFTYALAGGAIIDYHSQRFDNTLPAYKIIKTIYGRLSQDQLVSQTAYQHHKFQLNDEFHLNYQGSTGLTTPALNNNYYMFIMPDTGYTATNLGIQWEYSVKIYYVDN